MLGRATCDFGLTRFTHPGLGGSHHLPPYSILFTSPRRPHSNDFLSQDSQMGVSKLPRMELPRLCETITSCADLRSGQGLKRSCSPRQKLSNGVLHATCTQGNWVDSRLSMVESQIASLTLDLSFDHNLCFRFQMGRTSPF